MIIDFNIPVISIVLFAIAAVALLYISIFYVSRLNRVRRRRRRCDATEAEADHLCLPKASVIVSADEDPEVLEPLLRSILDQRFPGTFEVIVVNDGGDHDIEMLVTRLKSEYSNLYLTFTPDSSQNISRRKLAITLGIKASKSDIVVITDGSARVYSDLWLSHMIAPFTDNSVEVVIGYSAPLNAPKRWFGRLTDAFDIAADDVVWLSSAIGGKPYRASANNVAYRRDTFFRNRGFQNSLNKSNGDDDLFINEIANAGNTVVQLSSDSITTWGLDDDMAKRMPRYRLSHAFTGRELPKAPRRLMAVGELMTWIVVIAALAGAFTAGLYNPVGWGIAAVLVLIMLIMLIVLWRKTVISLGGPKLCLTLPFMVAFRPLRNALVNLRAGSYKNANYTWQ